MSFCFIILAGGNSHRFRSNIGKPYQKIAGKSLLEINVNKARKIRQIKKIIIVFINLHKMIKIHNSEVICLSRTNTDILTLLT